MSDPWPVDIPASLWSYHLLTPENRPYLPMMGVQFSPGFLNAFAFGAIFVAFFAWNRFRLKSDSTQFDSYSVLKDIGVTQLGGNSAMLRAYFIYAFALLLAYVAMTFFGKLILQTAQAIPLAGIAVDIDSLKFDSPQWPLTIAFGFAGLAPLLPPLEFAETWLRNRAFRAVGIPVRIEQTTRHVVTLLGNEARPRDSDPAPHRPLRSTLHRLAKDLDAQLDESAWWGSVEPKRRARREDLVYTCTELELLVHWAKTCRGVWPGPQVSRELRTAETKEVEKADTLLTDFRQRLAEPKPKGDLPSARQLRRDTYVTDTIASARERRDNLAALLAIYTERDPLGEDGRHIDPALRELLRRAEPPDQAGTGPEAGVLLALPIVFLIYLICAWTGLHALLVPSAPTNDLRTLMFTASVETLRVASLVWLPLVVAFSFRQYLSDNRDWVRLPTRQVTRHITQRLAAVMLGAVVGVIGLCGVAMLSAFAIADNVARFREILFGGVASILYYPTQIAVTFPIVLFSLYAADARSKDRSGLWLGVCSLGLVALIVGLHYAAWNGEYKSCIAGRTFLTDIASTQCFAIYEALNYIILPLLAFLSAAMFGNHAPRRPRRANGSPQRRIAAAAVALALVALLPSGAHGSEGFDDLLPPEVRAPKTIVIGFRPDVEPFSYAAGMRFRGQPGKEPRLRWDYTGFLADLCHGLFEDSDEYIVQEREVTVRNRFDLLRRRGDPDDADKIDLLCDPVTMRFTDEERSGSGIYSSIVFASGVSYLPKLGRRSGDLYISYVTNTTAGEVARRACMVDLFRTLQPGQNKGLFQRCEFAWRVARAHEAALDLQAMFDDMRTGSPGQYGDEALDAKRDRMRDELEAALALSDPPSGPGQPDSDYADEDLAFEKRRQKLHGLYWRLLRPETVIDATLAETALAATDDPACWGKAPPITPKQNETRRVLYRFDTHFCVGKSHDALIQWFCGPDSSGRRAVYMGDRELIQGKIAAWERERYSCGVEGPEAAGYLTYEPYALLISAKDVEFVQFVQRRIHEFFSHRQKANSLFATYFPGLTMSPALAYLFLLNGVEDERLFQPALPEPELPPVNLVAGGAR